MRARSLTTRLVLLLTACITVTLVVITTIDYQLSRQALLAEVEIDVEVTVREAVRDLEVRLTSLEESTELLAEVVAQGRFDQEELRALLYQAVDEREDLFGAALALAPRWSTNPELGFAPYYYYKGGEILFSDLARAYDYANMDWFKRAMEAGEPVWSEPYFDRGGGDVYMSTYSVPIFMDIDGGKVLYGVATADITLSELQYYLDRMDLGQNGFGFLISTESRLMAAPRPENLLKPVLDILPAGQDQKLWEGMLDQVAQGGAASAVVPCRDFSGECVVKLAPLQTTRWPVGAFYVEEEMLAPLREYLRRSIISSVLTLVLLSLAVVAVSRRITQPLRSLSRATVDIATGNFHSPLPQARTRDELGQLVHAFSLMQTNLETYVEKLEREASKRARLVGELDAASEIQMSMLPAGGKAHLEEPGFALWAMLRPAKSVGGDLYAVHREVPGYLFLAVGDVSDKGIPAAIFMARAMTLLNQYARMALAAEDILARLNDDLADGNENYMFVTLTVGWLELSSLEFRFASGGHTPPSLVRHGQAYSAEQAAGPALGLSAGLEFPSNTLQLKPGDRLGVYTDGIDEAFDEAGAQFGIDAFNRLLERLTDDSLESAGRACISTVDRHTGSAPQSDDITLLLLDIHEAADPPVLYQLASDNISVAPMLEWLGTQLQRMQVPEETARELLLVTDEVASNIIKYAQVPTGKSTQLQLLRDNEILQLEFRDPGIAFDPLTIAEESPDPRERSEPGGLGVHLVMAFTDQQEYQRREGLNCLRLTRHINGEDSEE